MEWRTQAVEGTGHSTGDPDPPSAAGVVGTSDQWIVIPLFD